MTENKETKPQEIDLIELFTNIGNWFVKQAKWLFGIFVSIFYFFLRNTLWFLLIITGGVIFAFFIHRASPNYYKSQLIGYSHTVSNVEVIRSINNWNYTSSFTIDKLENIKAIGATYVLDINNDGIWDNIEDLSLLSKLDTNVMKQRLYGNFCIQVEVYDTTLIYEIKNKILDYISNNKRVIERNSIRLKQYEELIPKLKKEMDELDSLKRMEYFEKNKPMQAKLGEMILLGEKETKLYHNELISLYKQQQAIERELYLNEDPYEIILDFSIPNQEENNLTVTAIKIVKIFLLVGFFIILFFDQRKFIMQQIKNSKKH